MTEDRIDKYKIQDNMNKALRGATESFIENVKEIVEQTTYSLVRELAEESFIDDADIKKISVLLNFYSDVIEVYYNGQEASTVVPEKFSVSNIAWNEFHAEIVTELGVMIQDNFSPDSNFINLLDECALFLHMNDQGALWLTQDDLEYKEDLAVINKDESLALGAQA